MSEAIVCVIIFLPVWLPFVLLLIEDGKGKVIEKRGNRRLKEGERIVGRGTRYIMTDLQYRKQFRILFIWWTYKWISIGNYHWMKQNGFEVI